VPFDANSYTMRTMDTQSLSANNSRTDKSRLPRDERRAILLAAALEVFTAAGTPLCCDG
jgi:hypothetical protein